MDKYKSHPEHFLRKPSSFKVMNQTMGLRRYHAKVGHNPDFGRTRLIAEIEDFNTHIEIGLTKEKLTPIVEMTSRADKRFDHDLRSNELDMNRTYSKSFNSRMHHSDLNHESVVQHLRKEDNFSSYKRHLEKLSKDDSNYSSAFDKPLPLMKTNPMEKKLERLNKKLMENRADSIENSGRDPTIQLQSTTRKEKLQKEETQLNEIKNLKEQKMKSYFKQLDRAWSELKRNRSKKGAIFPNSTEQAELETASEESLTSNTGQEGVNTIGER